MTSTLLQALAGELAVQSDKLKPADGHHRGARQEIMVEPKARQSDDKIDRFLLSGGSFDAILSFFTGSA